MNKKNHIEDNVLEEGLNAIEETNINDYELWDLEEFGTIENAKRMYKLLQNRSKQPSISFDDFLKEMGE